MTKLQREYAKHEKRIKSFLKRAEKRGYIAPDNILPDRPKRITRKSIERLAYLKPDRLYAKMEYLIPQTGEVISGTRGRKLERQVSALKGIKSRKDKVKTLKSIYNEYGLDEYDLTGEYTPIETGGYTPIETDDITKESDTNEFNLDEEMGRIMFDNFVQGARESLFDKAYELLIEGLLELVKETSIVEVGYALNEMPVDVIDYFTSYGHTVYEAVDHIKMDVVKRLPIKQDIKEKLMQEYDAYGEGVYD